MLKVEHRTDYLKKEGDNSEIVDLLKEEQTIELQAWERKSILNRLKRADDYDQKHVWQTLEDETAKCNYEYWLQQRDIADIARTSYQYDQGYDEQGRQTQSKTIFEICDLNSLNNQLVQFKDYVDINRESRPLTLIINLNAGHWVTLIVQHKLGNYYAYYSDSLGNGIHNYVKSALTNKISPKVNIFDLKVEQQEDSYNCGIFSLLNANKINILIEDNKPFDEVFSAITGMESSSNFLKDMRGSFSEKLKKDSERLKTNVRDFACGHDIYIREISDSDINQPSQSNLKNSQELDQLFGKAIEEGYLSIAAFAVKIGVSDDVIQNLSNDEKKNFKKYIEKHDQQFSRDHQEVIDLLKVEERPASSRQQSSSTLRQQKNREKPVDPPKSDQQPSESRIERSDSQTQPGSTSTNQGNQLDNTQSGSNNSKNTEFSNKGKKVSTKQSKQKTENSFKDLFKELFQPDKNEKDNLVDIVNKKREKVISLIENLSSNSDVYFYNEDLFTFVLIAKNIHFLKRQLKSLYGEFQWEEVDFYLSNFVNMMLKMHHHLDLTEWYKFKRLLESEVWHSSETKSEMRAKVVKCDREIEELQKYLIPYSVDSVMREELMENLNTFLTALKKRSFTEMDISRDLPDASIEEIPGFSQSFYDNYKTVKDPYSLGRILHYIELALSINPSKKLGKFVIERALQVAGEYLKYTYESPHLSNTVSQSLIDNGMSSEEIKSLKDTRNLLSHSKSLSALMEIENEGSTIFADVQVGLKKVKDVIEKVYYDNLLNESIILINMMDFSKIVENEQSCCELEKKLKELKENSNSRKSVEGSAIEILKYIQKEKIGNNEGVKKIKELISQIVFNIKFGKIDRIQDEIYGLVNKASDVIQEGETTNSNMIEKLRKKILENSENIDEKNTKKVFLSFNELLKKELISQCEKIKQKLAEIPFSKVEVFNAVLKSAEIPSYYSKWLKDIFDEFYRELNLDRIIEEYSKKQESNSKVVGELEGKKKIHDAILQLEKSLLKQKKVMEKLSELLEGDEVGNRIGDFFEHFNSSEKFDKKNLRSNLLKGLLNDDVKVDDLISSYKKFKNNGNSENFNKFINELGIPEEESAELKGKFSELYSESEKRREFLNILQNNLGKENYNDIKNKLCSAKFFDRILGVLEPKKGKKNKTLKKKEGDENHQIDKVEVLYVLVGLDEFKELSYAKDLKEKLDLLKRKNKEVVSELELESIREMAIKNLKFIKFYGEFIKAEKGFTEKDKKAYEEKLKRLINSVTDDPWRKSLQNSIELGLEKFANANSKLKDFLQKSQIKDSTKKQIENISKIEEVVNLVNSINDYSLKNIEISTIEKDTETPIENLISKLDKRDPSNWQSKIDCIKSLNNYESFAENYGKFINSRDETSFRNLLSSLRVERQELKESEKQLLNDIFNELNKLELDNIVDAFKEKLFKKFEEFVENFDIKLGKAFKVISQLFNAFLSSVDKDKTFSEEDRKLVEKFSIDGKFEDIKLGKTFKVISLFNDFLSSVDKDQTFSEEDRKLVENFLIYENLFKGIKLGNTFKVISQLFDQLLSKADKNKKFSEEDRKLLNDVFFKTLAKEKEHHSKINLEIRLSELENILPKKQNKFFVDKKLQAALEVILCGLLDILVEVEPKFELERSIAHRYSIMLDRTSLRNYLAHGGMFEDTLLKVEGVHFGVSSWVFNIAQRIVEKRKPIIALKQLVEDTEVKEYLIGSDGSKIDEFADKIPQGLQNVKSHINALKGNSEFNWKSILKEVSNSLKNPSNELKKLAQEIYEMDEKSKLNDIIAFLEKNKLNDFRQNLGEKLDKKYQNLIENTVELSHYWTSHLKNVLKEKKFSAEQNIDLPGIFRGRFDEFCTNYYKKIIKSELLDSIRYSNVVKIQHCLNLISENIIDLKFGAKEHTLLHYAAKYSDLKTIKFLIGKGAKVETVDKNGETPLFYAVAFRSKEDFESIVNLFSQTEVIKTIKSNEDWTLLHYAAQAGNLEIIEYLLSDRVGADFYAKNDNLEIPLHIAAIFGHKEIVKFFIESKSIAIDIRDKHGYTSLHHAAGGANFYEGNEQSENELWSETDRLWVDENKRLKVIEYLVNKNKELTLFKTNPEKNNGNGELTALHLAAIDGNNKITELLIEKSGEGVKTFSQIGTALHYAAINGNKKIVVTLIEKGADIEACTTYGHTSLHLAAYKGHEKVVGALLDHVQKKLINKLSEIVNAKTNDNWTPLHLAARENYSDVVKILLSSGAIYNAKTEQEETPLHLAQENSEIHRLLSNIENLFTDIGKNEVESINELLQSKGADIIKAIVNAQDNRGGSPLHYAAWKGYVEITKVLLGKGANPNIAGKNGDMPLHYAAKFGKLEIVRLLLQNKARYDVENNTKGKTPLHYAAQEGYLDVVKLLLDNGADPNILDKDKKTPLQLAEEHLDQKPQMYQEIVRLIEQQQKIKQQVGKVSAEECVLSTRRSRRKRNIRKIKSIVCIDSRNEEDITKEEKEHRIREFFGVEAYDVTVDFPQVSIDNGKVYVKVIGNDKKLIIDNAANIQSTENYILDKENLEITLKASSDKEHSVLEGIKGQGAEYFLKIDGYKIKLGSIIESFEDRGEAIFNKLRQLSNDKQLLENKKCVEDISSSGDAEITDQDYNNIVNEVKQSLLLKGVEKTTFERFQSHFEELGGKVFTEYIDNVRKDLEKQGIAFNHDKFKSARTQGAKAGKFFSLMAIYDLIDSIGETATLRRHNNDVLKQVFGINGILDAMDDVRGSISTHHISSNGRIKTKISRDSTIGKVVSKVPDSVRKGFVKIISNPVVQSVTFATIAYQFGYSVNEITEGNHHPLNYYWTASSGVKLASMSIRPIVSFTIKSLNTADKILKGLCAAGKVLGRAAVVTMVADLLITAGVEIHERMERTKAIAEQVPLLPGDEQAEVFFARVIKFFTGKDVEKEYEDKLRIKGYLNSAKELAIRLLDDNYNIAAVVQYISSVKEEYGEVIKTIDTNFVCMGRENPCMHEWTCGLENKYSHLVFESNLASDVKKDLSLLNISKTLPMVSHILVMSKGWERFICDIKNSHKCHQEINEKEVYIANTGAKHVPHLTKYEYEDLGLRIVSIPSEKLKQNRECSKVINEERIYQPYALNNRYLKCNTEKIYRNCQQTFTLSGEPFIFTNPTRKDPYHLRKETFPKDSVLYISGPEKLIAAANYPAVMYVPEDHVNYVGSKNNETIFIINSFTAGVLKGGAEKENTVIMNVKANNIVIDLHSGVIHYGTTGDIKLIDIYNYVSDSDSKQNITTHCETRLINVKKAEVWQNSFNCTDKDYEVRVVNKKDIHHRGLKQTIFVVNGDSDNARIVSDFDHIGKIKKNVDIIDTKIADVTRLNLSEKVERGIYSLNLLADNTQNITSSIEIDSFNNLIIQAKRLGIKEWIIVQDKSLPDIFEDMKYQKLRNSGKDISREVIQNSEEKLKAVIQASILDLEWPNTYQAAKNIADNNNLGIPISMVEVIKNYAGIPTEKVIIAGMYSDQVIVDFSYNNPNVTSSYHKYRNNGGGYNFDDYMMLCNYYQDITVEGEKKQCQYIIKLPDTLNRLNSEVSSSPIRLNLKIKNKPASYERIPYSIIDFAELNVTNVESISIEGGENSYIYEFYNKSVCEIKGITILQNKGTKWSLSIGLVDYFKSPEYQQIVLRINDELYKIDSTNLKLEHVEMNTNSFKYYQAGEEGLQIYHNQPIDKNDIGLVDLKDKSILDFDMRVMNDSLVLSHKNDTLIKVENWNTYQPAREMMFAFNDTVISNSKCISSTCNPEDVIIHFNKEKLVLLTEQLFNAVKENNFGKVKELINQGIRFDVQDENIYGKKPIHIAAEKNNKNILKFLLSKGAKVTDTDNLGNTPLHYAAWRGCLEAAKFLVNKGANINAEDTSTVGKKPIHVAVENNNKNIVELLLSKGINTDEVDRNGWTPLHYTAWKGYLEVAKLLIEKDADVNAENVDGKRSIHHAAENDNKDIIELLLSKGVSVNDTDKDGRTPLHWASWNGHLGTIEYLIGKGADINAKDKNGKTPLNVAKNRGHDNIVECLEEKFKGERLAKRKRRHHHGDHNRFHLSQIPLAIDSSIRSQMAASSSTILSSWINDLFGWIKSSVSGLLGSKSEETLNTSSSISQVDAPVDVNGTIMLLDVLVRKVTNQKYFCTADQSISSREAQGFALNITKRFEKVVEQAGLKSDVSMHRFNIDYIGMQKEVTRKVMSGKFDEVSRILNSYVEKACPGREAECPEKLSSKKLDKFMLEFNSRLNVVLDQSMQQMLHNGNSRVGASDEKINSGPKSYLNNSFVQAHLTHDVKLKMQKTHSIE